VDTNLLSILCTSDNKSSTFGLFGPRGRPKTVNGWLIDYPMQKVGSAESIEFTISHFPA
jgi:hypothetical protein